VTETPPREPCAESGRKIALALERFSRHAGGAEAYAVDLSQALIDRGWKVHLYGHSWDGEPAGATFHEIPRLSSWVPPSLRIIHFALSHRRKVAEDDYDVVLGFGNTVAMNVYQSHGGVHRCSTMRKLTAVRNPAMRLLKTLSVFLSPKYYARAWIESAPFRVKPRPALIAISEMVREDLARHFQVPVQEIRLVYNGIDFRRFSASPPSGAANLRARLGFDREVLFLFMAYDFRKKGVRYLVEAAGELFRRVGPGKFGVVVVGRTPPLPLKRLVSKLHLDDTVVFPGPTREPEAHYQSCDVFVLPTFYDACSLVVFEAMAAGLPAITTVFNGAAGIISHGIDGMIAKDPRDINELADAMQRFLDPALLQSASAAARSTAEHYTLEANHAQMIEIMDEVASRSGSRSGSTAGS
jgi:UDP-glucose:(heptosyl)LPS alpha-1,3-glucosyltransferase